MSSQFFIVENQPIKSMHNLKQTVYHRIFAYVTVMIINHNNCATPEFEGLDMVINETLLVTGAQILNYKNKNRTIKRNSLATC